MYLNPYTAGNPIRNQSGFFGRDDVLREIMQVLRHPQSNAIVLFGQRRIGKTSILLEIERRLSGSSGYTPTYFDLQDKASQPLAEVLYELAQRIAAKTTKITPDKTKFDARGDYFRQIFLPIAADAAEPNGLVLLFDEFDVLDSPEAIHAGKSFFPYLRAWMSEVEQVHFVFIIGRRPEDLSIETISTFKGVRASRVLLLDREAADAVVRQSERDGSVFWTDAASDRVWYWTQGHAYLTQLLCYVVWENIYSANAIENHPVAESDVDSAISEALQQGANAFYWIWDGLPPAERVVMAAMAEAGDIVITSENLVDILNRSGVRLIVRELELAPETLVDWGLLASADKGYRFVIPMLRHWVTHNRPLRRVKEELDRLDPLAENLFQTGRHFYGLGQSMESEGQLRHALRINPNHLKSRLLLGRILLEDDRAIDATTILEEAYRYDESATRAELVRALLAVADRQNEESMLTTYERVLSIDPNQAIACERRAAIWISRGEEALDHQELETAIAAFQRASLLDRVEEIKQLIRTREIKTQVEKARVYEAKGEWDQAFAFFEGLIERYPDEADWGPQLKDAQVRAARWFEKNEDWAKATTLYRTLIGTFPGETEWPVQLQRVEHQEELGEQYSHALDLMKAGDTGSATGLLVHLMLQQPDYKEAARYVLLATTGVDVNSLVERLGAATAKAQDWQAILNTKKEPTEALHTTIEELRIENSELTNDLKIAKRELHKLENQLTDLQALSGELDASKKRIDTLRAALNNKGPLVARLLDEIDAANAQVLSLQMALDVGHKKNWRFGQKRRSY